MAEYEEGDGDDDAWDEYPEEPESPEADTRDVDDGDVLQECLHAFASTDYIMEPEIFNQLKRYFKAEGSPEQVVQLLSDNYTAVAQTVNLLAEWLIQSGIDIKDVQEIVEQHLHDMILKYFDPKKADSIFTDEGETPSWLAEMIEFPTWRNLLYKLAESYPDCLMLNFTVKLISDAGYQGEITSVSTACHQIEVFSRVLRTSVSLFLENGEEAIAKHFPEFAKMVCHGEHTYLYSQLLMHVLCQEPKGGSRIKRLCQEVHKAAKQRGFDVTPITLALSGAAAYPRACQALSSMLSRNALNPADITMLYKMYTSADPPPVELIRVPQFLDLFIEVLFGKDTKLNVEHKPKYIYIISYASSVVEIWKKSVRRSINKDELKTTIQALEKAQGLCSEGKPASELIADIAVLFQCLKFPVVAVGVVRWIRYTVTDAKYFSLNTDHTPLHLVLLDEVSSNHVLLHKEVMELLVQLFESSFDELNVHVRLELKKTLLDRMVHLLSCGYVLPVVSYIRKCWQAGDTDISLIRHFVIEILDVIAPPYTVEFVEVFLPLIECDDITGALHSSGESNVVTEFISQCRSMYSSA